MLDLPDTWSISNLRFENDTICFENERKEKFRIAPPKLNQLNFKIIEMGNSDQLALEELWREYAKIK